MPMSGMGLNHLGGNSRSQVTKKRAMQEQETGKDDALEV